jgi:hypothetical protein
MHPWRASAVLILRMIAVSLALASHLHAEPRVDCAGAPPPTSALGAFPYLVHGAAGSTDVGSVVLGGLAPFTCAFYTGAGGGTRPSGVQLDASSCTLTGGATAADAPGAYGFMVRATDACGASVDIPVAFQAAACAFDGGLVPAPWPPRVEREGGAGYTWTWSGTIDLFTVDNSCAYCAVADLTTSPPLSVSANLQCANAGEICSDCFGCHTLALSCPPDQQSIEMTRAITVKAHAPLRNDERPAWLTLGASLAHSGSQCPGNVLWRCHAEVLELANVLFRDGYE